MECMLCKGKQSGNMCLLRLQHVICCCQVAEISALVFLRWSTDYLLKAAEKLILDPENMYRTQWKSVGAN
jgi:hypothetical protein